MAAYDRLPGGIRSLISEKANWFSVPPACTRCDRQRHLEKVLLQNCELLVKHSPVRRAPKAEMGGNEQNSDLISVLICHKASFAPHNQPREYKAKHSQSSRASPYGSKECQAKPRQ